MPTEKNSSSSRQLIIVYMEDHPKTIMLLRAAKRRAAERQCKWCAVFIATPVEPQNIDEQAKERIARLRSMATQMGGETIYFEAETQEKGMATILEKEKTRLELVMIGGTHNKVKKSIFLSNPSWLNIAQVASRYTQVEIVQLIGQPYKTSIKEKFYVHIVRIEYAIYALVAVGFAYLSALILQAILPPALFRINDQNVGLLFMIACAFVAGRYGLMSGLVASVASFLTVNYYFTLPYHTLKLETVTDLLNMGLFLFAALLISLFTSQTRGYAQKATQQERGTQALFTLYRIASESHSREEALSTLQRRLEMMLEVTVAFFTPSVMYQSNIEPAFPDNIKLDEADRKALNESWSEMKTTGLGSPFNPGTMWRFEPMISSVGEVGILGVRPHGKKQLDAWFCRLLTAIADQTATILQHIRLERSMEEARMREEREKLRSMLLSSVSHDFKTPLAGIIGALSVFRSLGSKLPQAKREELIETAIEEALRLDSFITNILDMTRLESGSVNFRMEWYHAEGMVENVIRRMHTRCSKHVVIIKPCPEDIEVCMDTLMTEQVLQNVIDNACKYTKPGTSIEISCEIDNQIGFLCKIRDHGMGIPSQKLGLIFDKYTRLEKKDTQVAGTGLGLAIAKAVMEAQGGWISAENHKDGGALFTICLPKWRRSNEKYNEE